MSEHQFIGRADPWRIGCAACPRRAECASPCAGAESYASQDDALGYRRETPLSEIGDGEGRVVEAVDAALGRELWDAGETALQVAGVPLELDAPKAKAALATLTRTQQRRLRRRFVQGMSLREIARRERSDHKTVRESIEAALARVAGALIAEKWDQANYFSRVLSPRARGAIAAPSSGAKDADSPPKGPFFSISERDERGGER